MFGSYFGGFLFRNFYRKNAKREQREGRKVTVPAALTAKSNECTHITEKSTTKIFCCVTKERPLRRVVPYKNYASYVAACTERHVWACLSDRIGEASNIFSKIRILEMRPVN